MLIFTKPFSNYVNTDFAMVIIRRMSCSHLRDPFVSYYVVFFTESWNICNLHFGLLLYESNLDSNGHTLNMPASGPACHAPANSCA